MSCHRSFAFKLHMLEHMKASDLWELINDPEIKLSGLHALKHWKWKKKNRIQQEKVLCIKTSPWFLVSG